MNTTLTRTSSTPTGSNPGNGHALSFKKIDSDFIKSLWGTVIKNPVRPHATANVLAQALGINLSFSVSQNIAAIDDSSFQKIIKGEQAVNPQNHELIFSILFKAFSLDPDGTTSKTLQDPNYFIKDFLPKALGQQSPATNDKPKSPDNPPSSGKALADPTPRLTAIAAAAPIALPEAIIKAIWQARAHGSPVAAILTKHKDDLKLGHAVTLSSSACDIDDVAQLVRAFVHEPHNVPKIAAKFTKEQWLFAILNLGISNIPTEIGNVLRKDKNFNLVYGAINQHAAKEEGKESSAADKGKDGKDNGGENDSILNEYKHLKALIKPASHEQRSLIASAWRQRDDYGITGERLLQEHALKALGLEGTMPDNLLCSTDEIELLLANPNDAQAIIESYTQQEWLVTIFNLSAKTDLGKLVRNKDLCNWLLELIKKHAPAEISEQGTEEPEAANGHGDNDPKDDDTGVGDAGNVPPDGNDDQANDPAGSSTDGGSNSSRHSGRKFVNPEQDEVIRQAVNRFRTLHPDVELRTSTLGQIIMRACSNKEKDPSMATIRHYADDAQIDLVLKKGNSANNHRLSSEQLDSLFNAEQSSAARPNNGADANTPGDSSSIAANGDGDNDLDGDDTGIGDAGEPEESKSVSTNPPFTNLEYTIDLAARLNEFDNISSDQRRQYGALLFKDLFKSCWLSMEGNIERLNLKNIKDLTYQLCNPNINLEEFKQSISQEALNSPRRLIRSLIDMAIMIPRNTDLGIKLRSTENANNFVKNLIRLTRSFSLESLTPAQIPSPVNHPSIFDHIAKTPTNSLSIEQKAAASSAEAATEGINPEEQNGNDQSSPVITRKSAKERKAIGRELDRFSAPVGFAVDQLKVKFPDIELTSQIFRQIVSKVSKFEDEDLDNQSLKAFAHRLAAQFTNGRYTTSKPILTNEQLEKLLSTNQSNSFSDPTNPEPNPPKDGPTGGTETPDKLSGKIDSTLNQLEKLLRDESSAATTHVTNSDIDLTFSETIRPAAFTFATEVTNEGSDFGVFTTRDKDLDFETRSQQKQSGVKTKARSNTGTGHRFLSPENKTKIQKGIDWLKSQRKKISSEIAQQIFKLASGKNTIVESVFWRAAAKLGLKFKGVKGQALTDAEVRELETAINSDKAPVAAKPNSVKKVTATKPVQTAKAKTPIKKAPSKTPARATSKRETATSLASAQEPQDLKLLKAILYGFTEDEDEFIEAEDMFDQACEYLGIDKKRIRASTNTNINEGLYWDLVGKTGGAIKTKFNPQELLVTKAAQLKFLKAVLSLDHKTGIYRDFVKDGGENLLKMIQRLKDLQKVGP